MMKICSKCKILKEEIEFSFKNKTKNKLQSWCKECLQDHNRKTYIEKPNRKEQVKSASKRYKAKMEEFLYKYLTSHPCVACGQTNILTLQFDHLENKLFNIGSQATSSSIETIEKEIAKCQVLCANCHSIKSAQQLNSWKLKWLAR